MSKKRTHGPTKNNDSNRKFKKPNLCHSTEFFTIVDNLNRKLENTDFLNKISYVYNPTIYARASYEMYIKKYCNNSKKVMFMGMNPGPWGMSQTGVPFGEVDAVKNWMGIDGPVLKPEREHSLRPVDGFGCTKSEVSGRRFWGLMKEICGVAEKFFEHCFVYNFLPLQFIASNGKNITPTSLKKEDQEQLYKCCDKALREVINLYNIEIAVAIGKFAQTRLVSVLKSAQLEDKIQVYCILHPSPQSVAANNWGQDVLKQLQSYDLLKYLKQ